MKTYNVGVFFEEGAVLRVDADSIEEAREKVKEVLDSFGGVDYPNKYQQKTVYRDYMVTDVEESE